MPEATSPTTTIGREELVGQLLQVTWSEADIEATFREKKVTIDGTTSLEIGHGKILTFVSVQRGTTIFLSAGRLGALSRQEALNNGLMATETDYYIPVQRLFTEEFAFMLS